MHSAIFVATEPTNQQQVWLNFLDDARKNAKLKQHAERLAEGVWLVNFQESPSALSFLVSSAEVRAIAYRILPLHDEPRWIPAETYPKPR